MGKHLKDKKIIIYASNEETDAWGYPLFKWRPLHPGKLWAYARQLSAKEFYAAVAEHYQEERIFAINWRNDVIPGMMVFHNDAWYHIVRVDPFEGYKEDIKLYVKEALRDKPSENEIVSYE